MRRTAALIVGGGPAGAAAAILLARAGRRPLLLERSREARDPLCGGFVSWRTRATLDRLGVAPAGVPIRRLRLHAGGRQAEARLPAEALGLSRRALDAALLARACAEGAAVERGVHVREIDGRRARLADGAVLDADALFLASGKHDVRGLNRPRRGDAAIGLRVHLRPPAGLVGDAIELHLFDRGYAGLLMQEDGRANLCLAVHAARLAEAGGDPMRLIRTIGAEAPALGDRLAHLSDDAADAVAAVPYGWRARSTAPRVWRLGDQAAVIPSLAGEGIGIALSSGAGAAGAFLRGEAAEMWQAGLHDRLAGPFRAAGLLRALGEGRVRGLLPLLAGVVPGMARAAARLTRLPD